MAGMSKQAELESLKAFAARFQAGESYLASFFSEDLFKWLAHQMAEDVSCDVMDAWRYSGQTAAKNFATEVTKSEDKVDDLKARLGKQSQELMLVQQDLDYHREQLKLARDGAEGLFTRLKEEEMQLAEAQAKAAKYDRLMDVLHDALAPIVITATQAAVESMKEGTA